MNAAGEAVAAVDEGVMAAEVALAEAAEQARIARNAQARWRRIVRGAVEALADLDHQLRDFGRHLSDDHPTSLVIDLLGEELPHSEEQLESSGGAEILWHCRLLVHVGDLGGFDSSGRKLQCDAEFIHAARRAIAKLEAYRGD